MIMQKLVGSSIKSALKQYTLLPHESAITSDLPKITVS